MPSKNVFNKMLKADIRVDKCPYNRYDSLENKYDLEALFEILSKYKDSKGNHPIITTNFVTANPDFKKIKKSEYNEYHYELFTDTYKHYCNNSDTFEVCKQGISNKLIYPQFHGREHLNVNRWIKALKRNQHETRLAFQNEMFGLSTTITKENRKSYMAALDFDDISEMSDQKKILIEGLRLFKEIFGYESETFIAANYIWHSSLENTLASCGVKTLQGSFKQISPSGDGHRSRQIRHRMGEMNDVGQIYLTRNAVFEPSLNISPDPVADCLKEIETAFRWGKPAIICSHRLNFIGSIEKENRDKNLKLLNKLLGKILRKYQNVEFMSTDSLGKTIKADKAE